MYRELFASHAVGFDEAAGYLPMLDMSDIAQFADVPKVTRQQMTPIFSMGAKGGSLCWVSDRS